MILRRALAAVTLVVGLTAATALPAHASYKDGVAHQHNACTMQFGTGTTCNTWILANGAVIVGPNNLMQQQYNYVLVRCSHAGAGSWQVSTSPFGPFGNTGLSHPYCQQPAGGGVRWNLKGNP